MKINIILLISALFSISLIYSYPISLVPLDNLNQTQGNKMFNYTFNFTEKSDCTEVLLSHSEEVTTNPQGVAFINVNTTPLNSRPSYICEYRDWSLRKVHLIPDMFFRDLFPRDMKSRTINTTNITSVNWGNSTDWYTLEDFLIDTNSGNASWNESHANDLYINGIESNLNVNSSTYWNTTLTTFNSTQMTDSGGILTILESWFSGLFDTFFSAKDTDDLSEGSTNLYDNYSWNESHAHDLFDTTFNQTYADYSENVSRNYTLDTFTNWNTDWLSTFNQTYADYSTNVSINFTQVVFDTYNSTWDDVITDTNCNATGVCSGGDVAYMDYANTGNFNVSGVVYTSNIVSTKATLGDITINGYSITGAGAINFDDEHLETTGNLNVAEILGTGAFVMNTSRALRYGIGMTPDSLIDVLNIPFVSDSVLEGAFDLSPNINATANFPQVIRMVGQINPNIALTSMWIINNRVRIGGNSTNNITNAYGNFVNFDRVDNWNGTLTNGYGFYMDEASSDIKLTNQYGFFCDELTEADGDNYCVYADGSTPSYFGGYVTSNDGYFHAYDHEGNILLGTGSNWTNLTWDNETRKDASYTHSADSQDITINIAGDYKITYDVTGNTTSASARRTADWRAVKNSVEIGGTRRSSYHRILADGFSSASATFIHTFSAGDILTIQGRDDAGTDTRTVGDGCALTIERI